jgi:hypothetical protein
MEGTGCCRSRGTTLDWPHRAAHSEWQPKKLAITVSANVEKNGSDYLAFGAFAWAAREGTSVCFCLVGVSAHAPYLSENAARLTFLRRSLWRGFSVVDLIICKKTFLSRIVKSVSKKLQVGKWPKLAGLHALGKIEDRRLNCSIGLFWLQNDFM